MDEASAVASPDILRRTTAQYMYGDDDGNFELFCLFFHGLALDVAIRFVNIKVAGCEKVRSRWCNRHGRDDATILASVR